MQSRCRTDSVRRLLDVAPAHHAASRMIQLLDLPPEILRKIVGSHLDVQCDCENQPCSRVSFSLLSRLARDNAELLVFACVWQSPARS